MDTEILDLIDDINKDAGALFKAVKYLLRKEQMRQIEEEEAYHYRIEMQERNDD